MDFTLGEWLPDLAEVGSPGLRQALNVFPVLDGYTTFSNTQDMFYLGTPEFPIRGAFRGQTQAGTKFLVCGDKDNLYLSEGVTTWTNVSQPETDYGLSGAERWDFALYGDTIFAVHSSGLEAATSIPQYYDLESDQTTFQPLNKSADGEDDILNTFPSAASVVETVGEFIVTGNIVGQVVGSGIGTAHAGVHWSAIGNPVGTDDAPGWPLVGTQAAIDVQSDFQILEGDGGPITAIVAAAEFTGVFRERQVWRMDYVGAPNFFEFRKMDDGRGCYVFGCATSVGNNIYYPSEQGFMVFNGATVEPVGAEKVDRTWRNSVNTDKFENASSAHDPQTHTVYFAVPTTSDYPTETYVYSYLLNRWTKFDLSFQWIFTALGSGSAGLDNAPLATELMDWPDSTLASWVTATVFDLDSLVVNSATEGVYQCTRIISPDWQAAHVYESGEFVTSTDSGDYDDRTFACISGGTTASTGTMAPPDSYSGTDDNGVSWQVVPLVTGPTSGTSASTPPTSTDPDAPDDDGELEWTYQYTGSTPGLGSTDLDTDIGTSDESLAIFLGDQSLATFTGEGRLTGTIETRDFEMPNQKRAVLRNVRPIFGGSGTIDGMFAGRLLPNGEVVYTMPSSTSINSIGLIPTRVGGRYLRGKFTLNDEVLQFQGFDATIAEQGAR